MSPNPGAGVSDFTQSGFRAGTRFFVSLDARGGEYVQVTLRKAVDLPARGLQYLQNGDVQWYLLMALLSTLAIVGYFLKM